MMKVGLTGGIGSGKSTVADMFARRGAVVIDADGIARELVEPGQPALHELVDEFGEGIIAEDGSLRRSELARIAFEDPGATERLNAIMHPLIRTETQRRLAAAADAEVVLYDMPLLFETHQEELVDVVVVVDVPEALQVKRAVRRGLDEADVRRRMEVQTSRSRRVTEADFVIDNSGSRRNTERQVQGIWDELQAVVC
ncbi:MAG: dephospho-CoA kinase [Actinobacteria bacterium]|nr:dephospho-CoA kinase [Actinomycetota bacterium]